MDRRIGRPGSRLGAVSGEPWGKKRQLATGSELRHDSVEKEESGKEVERWEGLCNFAREEIVQH